MREAVVQKYHPDLLFCAREAICLTGIQEFPLYHGGSGAVFSLEGRFFFVTAAHNLKNCDVQNVRVLYSFYRKEFVPMKAIYHYPTVDNGESDSNDLTIVLLDNDSIEYDYFNNEKPYELDWFDAGLTMVAESIYIFRGFPHHLRKFPDENGSVEMAYINLEAKLKNRVDNLIYELTIPIIPDFDINGMSGSAVFQIHHPYFFTPTISFAGMVVRGSAANGIVRMVHADRIYGALKEILRMDCWAGQTEYIPD
jgi:hypothetical protein